MFPVKLIEVPCKDISDKTNKISIGMNRLAVIDKKHRATDVLTQ